jgi:penicillin-binding protein 1A
MMAAVKRTGRYKQMKAEGMSEDSIMLDFQKRLS